MASAVYSEPPSSRLSISLEGTASASPFPSPSSSFLPPPTPGAHEFAVKPVPPARNGRKSSNGNTASHPQATLPTPTLVSEPDPVNGDAAAATAVALDSKQPSFSQRSSLSGSAAQAHTNGIPQIPLASKESINSIPVPPLSPALISPMTPTPSSIQRQIMPKEYLEPSRSPSHFDHPNSTSTTPTKPSVPLPSEEMDLSSNGALNTSTEAKGSASISESTSPPANQESCLSKIIIPDSLVDAPMSSSGLNSPMATPSSTSKPRPISTISTSSTSTDPSLFSNRPAPPSPAMSRRVSGAPSVASSSARSRSSRPSSTVVSRTNSLRKSTHTSGGGSISARSSPVINPHRQSVGSQLSQSFFAPLPSPQNLTFALNVQQPQPSTSSNVASGSTSPSAASTSGPASVTALITANIPTSPVNLATPTTTTPSRRASAVVYIKIRDFGFPPSDERHMGLGPEVPKPNRIGRMNRRLGGKRTMSQGSVSSSDGDGLEDEEEEDDDGWGSGGCFGGFGGGGGGFGGGGGGFSVLGRFNWNTGANAATVMENERLAAAAEGEFPSRMDLDRNFLDGDSESGMEDDEDDEEYFDAVNQDEDEEDTLYPGLYRALYAFEPEGTAEMRLEEDQIVRVVGRGGGVGWAVVIDDSASKTALGEDVGVVQVNGNGSAQPKHALVPESYLEPVKLDWEEEEAAALVADGVGAHEEVAPGDA